MKRILTISSSNLEGVFVSPVTRSCDQIGLISSSFLILTFIFGFFFLSGPSGFFLLDMLATMVIIMLNLRGLKQDATNEMNRKLPVDLWGHNTG